LGAKLVALFDVRGRINRARYWRAIVTVVVVLAMLLIAFWVYALSIPGAYENGGPTPFPRDPLGIAGALLWFALLALGLAAGFTATIRRLHDRNMAWWWILILVIVPNILYGGAQYLTDAIIDMNVGVTYAMRIAAIALSLWAVIELGFLPGAAATTVSDPIR
jgi:uncharacterized membrane protein YhaH (DUF805 family)